MEEAVASTHPGAAVLAQEGVESNPFAKFERTLPPAAALATSGAALAVAGVASVLWRGTGGYGALVWILALVPLFLLSYYKGWKGAALATAGTLVVFLAAEAVSLAVHGTAVNWELFGALTASLLAVTAGVGTVSELLHRTRSEALELAHRDPLTSLANRRSLRMQAQTALALADRGDHQVALIFLDLVAFKRVNDTLGHAAGDQVLTEVGRRLTQRLRAADTAARVGGDEFAILLSEVRGTDAALKVARRLRNAFAPAFHHNGNDFHLHARFGVAVYPEHADDFDQLLSNADRAIYRAKGDPGSPIALYHEELDRPSRDTLALEGELHDAIDNDELVLYYQPIFALPEGELAGAEALLRWNHPERGLLAAADFVPSAERAGLTGKLDRWVLREAMAQAEKWARQDGPGWVTVNLLPSFFSDPDLLAFLTRLFRDDGYEAENLVLEVSERVGMRDPKSAAGALKKLHAMGVRVLIDDFGTEYLSLAYLEHFTADLLKLDLSFATRLGHDPAQERLVEGIMALANGLGMNVVAGGVEEEDQHDWLVQTDCDYVQGFFTGRPVPAEDITWSKVSRHG